MALTNSYVLPVNRIPDLFRRVQDGQAPEQFTYQLLKDWGFTSTNDRAFIPLLKSLGFLTADGKPTQRYLEYRDHSRSKQIMAQAVRDAYGEIFLIKEHPTNSDRNAVEGKFKSFHNASDNVASLMAKTFFGLLPLADLSSKGGSTPSPSITTQGKQQETDQHEIKNASDHIKVVSSPGLHYNIQIHLPATKDTEVYNLSHPLIS